MTDSIKRSDAIGAITNHCENECYYRVDNWCPQCQREEFQKAIKAVPSADRPRGEWIPCSERLPNENGDYLVTLENGVVKILGYSTTQRTTYPKGFYHIEDGFSWRQVQNPVVAWMPLPKPWEGADDE